MKFYLRFPLYLEEELAKVHERGDCSTFDDIPLTCDCEKKSLREAIFRYGTERQSATEYVPREMT